MGIPIHFKKLKKWGVEAREDCFEHKLASWMGKHLSYGDRLVPVISIFTSLPMFILSLFEIPIGVRK
jgi:hypothetical protein